MMIQIDIPMPKNCAECPCSELDEIMDEYSCNIVAEIFRIGEEDARAKRHEKCPLKETPDINVGKWISVKDRLPDAAGVAVLVTAVSRYGQKNVFEAFQGYGDFKWYTMDVTKMSDRTAACNEVSDGWTITHWMPLPEPQEDNTNEAGII